MSLRRDVAQKEIYFRIYFRRKVLVGAFDYVNLPRNGAFGTRKKWSRDMKTQMTILAIALGAVALVGTAEAKSADHRGAHMSFEELDTDNDGQVTQAEMEAQGAARFAKVDADGDGFLSAAELDIAAQERAKKRAAHMIERMDTDGDGQLSLEEMGKGRDGISKRGAKMFERMDADNSGGLSKEEFEAAKAKMRKHGPGGKHGAKHGKKCGDKPNKPVSE